MRDKAVTGKSIDTLLDTTVRYTNAPDGTFWQKILLFIKIISLIHFFTKKLWIFVIFDFFAFKTKKS